MAREAEAESRMRTVRKAPTAYRTISEVSEDIGVPQHVLRFWETKFSQIRPLKRGGGRRYYRPEDIQVLRRIQRLLYEEGYTIKGVQRLLKEQKGDRTTVDPEEPAYQAPRGRSPGPELPLDLPEMPERSSRVEPSDQDDPDLRSESGRDVGHDPLVGALPPEIERELSLLLMELQSLKSLLTGAER